MYLFLYETNDFSTCLLLDFYAKKNPRNKNTDTDTIKFIQKRVIESMEFHKWIYLKMCSFYKFLADTV